MSKLLKTINSSLIKKFVMAITGFVLVSFLFIHMLGNLQTFEGGPHAINVYARFLQTLPWEILWSFRGVMALCIVLHFLMGYLLVLENKKARPQKYAVQKFVTASLAARTMIYSGTVIIIFVVFHLMHFTILNLDPVFSKLHWIHDGTNYHDVYAMMIYGFSSTAVSVGYIVALAIMCYHLSHAVSSMFQSLGLRNEQTRKYLGWIAIAYSIIIFLGFSTNPAAVLASKYTPCKAFPVESVVSQIEAAQAAGAEEIYVNYACCDKKAECSDCNATVEAK